MSRFMLFGFRPWLAVLSVAFLAGCAGVKVNAVKNDDYLASRRGDVLTTGSLSALSRTALEVVGSNEKACRSDLEACRRILSVGNGLADENRLSALAELWLLEAMSNSSTESRELRIGAYLESARHAYAYLFFTARPTSLRALEDRQTQVRDYYNFAVQEALTNLFQLRYGASQAPLATELQAGIQVANWVVGTELQRLRLAEGHTEPQELIPAASLSFAGLRNQYRRDGLGAELVAVTRKRVVTSKSDQQPWSETPFPAISAIIQFPGATLEQVLATNQARVIGYDPYRTSHFEVAGQSVPLAANYTSGYGLWLARSGFARQSLLTLIGRGEVLETPHLYLLQPYDPDRHIIIMLHGLASSPEAWINVANEVLGDETLRNNYQIWQIYYPTNLPIAFNNKAIRDTIEQTLKHFDPQGSAVASRDIVLVGHSMGGVLSRLLVSSSQDQLWSSLVAPYRMSQKRQEKARASLAPYLSFEPMPQVSRVVFAAAPHRGTPFAENRLSRWASGLIKLPVSVLGRFNEIAQLLVDPNSAAPVTLTRGFNSIDNLSARDPFVRAAAGLPISPDVRYHSIIGNYTPELPLADSIDGVVPYASAHLAGAQSEKVIASWHSVQEAPEAIVEIRRILHQHLDEAAP
ncbi:esterase/lipase family protein [Pseudomonas sp. B392_1p]|uniref:esterase/lipase family protein n=1 Tax=Pseudomonas sp. B392_1p TaxID=3457507 RepID=UPI003FD4DE18